MCLLDKSQIAIIVADVEKASITFSHLKDDLIDHICCEVEQEIERGKNFEDAYNIVKQQAGINVLHKIQEDTRYLTDKNYRTMKKTMKTTGLIAMILLAISTVFKIMHWPGAGPMLVLGFVNLALIFLPITIILNYRSIKANKNLAAHILGLLGGMVFMVGVLFKIMHWPTGNILLSFGWLFLIGIFLPILMISKLRTAKSNRDKTVYIIGFISLMIYQLGNVFKIMHWPGAAILMLVGSVMLISIFLPMFTFGRFKVEGKITGQFIFIIISSMFFILFTTLLALNVSKSVLEVFVDEEYASAKIANYLEKKNDKLYVEYNSLPDSIKAKTNEQITKIKESSDDIYKYISDIKITLITATEKVNEQRAIMLSQNLDLINNKDNYDLTTYLMLGENGNGFAYELKHKLESFKVLQKSVVGNNEDLINQSNILINFDFPKDKYLTNWETYKFYHFTIVDVLSKLTDFEKKVRMLESESIQYLMSL